MDWFVSLDVGYSLYFELNINFDYWYMPEKLLELLRNGPKALIIFLGQHGPEKYF